MCVIVDIGARRRAGLCGVSEFGSKESAAQARMDDVIDAITSMDPLESEL